MASTKIRNSIAVAVCFLSSANAQDQMDICYGPGSVVGAVLGTLITTLCFLASCFFLYKMYWKSRKGKHLVLMSDAENPNDQYAFDNPCFREATPIKHNIQEEKQTSKLDKNKWLGWSPLHSFGKEQKSEKLTSMDDSYLNDSRMKVVTLKSHDFTGLGFNICGNMRDGIFVKDVLHRGPAFESGCINPGMLFKVVTQSARVLQGDRINSVCINFRNMVFEDALAILSYASPYDVQVQVENDSYSRPSTLIRSKRESNAVSSTEKIRHPKYNRSQSISHLNEIGKNNKGLAHQVDFMQEKNRINQSLNKSQDYHGGSNDYPTIKLSPSVHEPRKENQKLEKNAMMKTSPMIQNKKSPKTNAKERESTSEQGPGGDPQNKLQKFGIKVLPISINPKMGVQSVTGTKKVKEPPKSPPNVENEMNTSREKPEKPVKPKLQDTPTRGGSPAMESSKEPTGLDEPDANKENVKGMLAKGFHNLKEKINQNTLGKKKNRETGNESNADDDSGVGFKTNVTVTVNKEDNKSPEDISENDGPVPKLRSTVACGVKAYEKSQHNHSQTSITIPEEVSRAGDVARNNRKSITDPVTVSTRKSVTSLIMEPEEENSQGKSEALEKKVENASDSDSSSERGSFRTSDGTKKPKKSKGKAPAPPMSAAETSKDGKPSVSSKQTSGISSKEINEIKRESELVKDETTNIFEPTHSDTRTISLRDSNDEDDRRNHLPSYDSDSDTEPRPSHLKERPENTKIELNATQVTIHQGPSSDGNDEDIEPSRKAASLGDLSKLDSEQPLSIVLERAVSLDLADGASQCGKKRKAPLPPSEEFPAVFDDLNYRKEPRLENSLGLNTFQRRLKKSSDFGTLEDALYDGPKSLEIEVNKHISPLDLTETHNSNIQEFSSWLAECRRPKGSKEEVQEVSKPTRMHSTSLVNINSSESLDKEGDNEDTSQFEFQGNNVSFSVNGKNFPDFQVNEKVSTNTQSVNFPGTNSRTVVVISQPNSLDPTVLETVPLNYSQNEEASQNTKEPSNESAGRLQSAANEDETTLEQFVTASESRMESFKSSVEDNETPPKLPTSPMPIMSTSSTLSSPLSSSLTYITEIKVSTSEKDVDNDSRMSKEPESLSPSVDSVSDDNELESTPVVSSTPLAISRKPGSVKALSERIEKFDSKPFESKSFVVSPINSRSNSGEISLERKDSNDFMKKDNQTVFESSKIPIRAMKSETGQKVLATIQSLAAKDSSPTKTPELEYARRVASLFSGNNSPEKNQGNVRKQTEIIENEINRPNISGFYLKTSGTSPPKPSKDFFPTRKVPPVVPPRKMETSLTNKSTVSVELPATNQGTGQAAIINEKMSPSESQERNIVTFSSFMPKNQTEDMGTSSVISFKIKEHGEINGGHLHGQDSVMPIKTSATKIVFESKDNKDDF